MKTLTNRSSQAGAALIVVLLMLVIVTLLGIAAMRGALLQEKMAASATARAMAFQAAEAGLRQAELIVRDGAVTLPTGTPQTCANGLCGNPGSGTPLWQVDGFWADGGTGYRTGAAVGTGVGAIAPKFIIEAFGSAATGSSAQKCVDLSKPCMSSARQNIYRMTSYASTPNGVEVIVQSLYRH